VLAFIFLTKGKKTNMNAPFDDQYIQLLAHKWKQGTLTEKERADFLSWYNEHNDEYIDLSEHYSGNSKDLKDKMFAGIKDRISYRAEPKAVPLRRTWISIAIAATLAAAIGTSVYKVTQKSQPTIPTTSIQANQVSPGANKAILQLSSGESIALSENSNTVLSGEKEVSIINTKEGSLIYGDTQAARQSNNARNTLITPKGGQYSVQLPDGTKVWLNADSRLEYPVSFNGQEQRVVSLSGEAYFQVARDKEHPFIVRTERQEVRVLGTHFNINSYKEEGRTVTTLEEGAVMVSSGQAKVVIRPGEQTILRAEGAIKRSKANMDMAMGWRRNEMVFKDATIQQVMRQVSRWYDLEVEYKGHIANDTFTGTLDRTANLDTILRMLATIQVHFTLEQTTEGRKLIIGP